mgnify:CR=1 FL=1
MMNALKPILFQFTPLREGRHVSDEGVRVHFYFNSRPSARGDIAKKCEKGLYTISIHAPPRGATCAILVSSAGSISIHAPPRGATRACWLAADGADISIHAPPRGATEQNRRESGRRSYFNSRPSARGDLIDKYKTIDYTNFNSRPSARGDAFSRRGATYSQFQFTPLREGRPLSRRFLLSEENFNSRPSARGDEREPADDGAGNYFNSRPSARGDGLVG